MTAEADSGARLRAVHTRTTVLGLLLVLAALLVLVAADLVRGETAALEAFGVPATILAIVAALAWRFGAWSKVLAALLTLLLSVAMGEVVVPALAEPADVVGFVSAALFVTGAILAVVGGVGAVVRRRDRRLAATFAERHIAAASLAGVGLLALFAAVMALTGDTAVEEARRAGASEVVVRDREFGDGTVVVAAGEPATLVVDNRDWERHTFTVAELGVDVELRPGAAVVVELPALDAGTYHIDCRPHDDHEATLVIE